jgi:hypothetical protein
MTTKDRRDELPLNAAGIRRSRGQCARHEPRTQLSEKLANVPELSAVRTKD